MKYKLRTAMDYKVGQIIMQDGKQYKVTSKQDGIAVFGNPKDPWLYYILEDCPSFDSTKSDKT